MTWSSQAVVADQVFVQGTGDGVFVYQGTPGPGTLIVALTGDTGTDPYGNNYDVGLTLPNGGQMSQISGNAEFSLTCLGAFNAGTFDFTPDRTAYAQGNITYQEGTSGQGELVIASPVPLTPGTDAQAVLTLDSSTGGGATSASISSSAPMVAVQPGTTVPETWHALPYAAQWSNAAGFQAGQYRLNVDGSVSVRGRAQFTSNGTTGLSSNGTLVCTLPSGYRPAASQGWPVPCYGSPTLASNRIASLVIGQTGAGQLTLFNVSSSATNGTTVTVDLTGTYWP